MATTKTKPAKPAEPEEVEELLTDSELAATERARKKLLDPFRRYADSAPHELAALEALAVLVRASTPDPVAVVDDPLAVIANELGVPRLPDFLQPRVDDTGLHVGLVEELRAKLAETQTIPVVAGEPEPPTKPAWAATRQQPPLVVKPRRRRLFSRRDEEDWP